MTFTSKFLASLSLINLLLCASLSAQHRELLDYNWRFELGDDSACVNPTFNDQTWRQVDLPHDWSIEGSFSKDHPMGNDGGYLPAGVAWYRLVYHDNPSFKAQSFSTLQLYFEGVYQKSSVYVNGQLAGGHPYGYASFWVDVTPFWKPGQDNVVAVRVDNSAQKNCRWYSGSGIYRHVWLYGMHKGRMDDPWKLFVQTGELKGISADGTLADTATVLISYGSYKETRTYYKVKLWSPEHPVLYPLTVGDLKLEHGFRTITYSAQTGLLLNGQPYVLNGGCLHHDNGIIGAAAYDAAEWRKARLLKEAGFNAARTAHNPPSEEFIKACDHLGLLVIDEAFDGLRAKKTAHDYHELIDEWWEADVDALVLRDRNHASVLCWSNGNEVFERRKLEIVTTSRKLARRMHADDPSRGVTQALCGWDKDWEIFDPLAETLDIMGYNYLIQYAESDHERVPERVMWQTESYPIEAFKSWEATQKHPYVLGDFVWTALDYLGESGIGRAHYASDPADRGEHWEGSKWPWHGAYCGDIDLTGWRKPISHYRDLLWNDREERLFMAVREPDGYRDSIICTAWSVWPTWLSWNWPGWEGKEVEVEIYSRYQRVHLYFNDELVADCPTTLNEEFKAIVPIKYKAGTLKAVGVKADGTEDTQRAQTLSTTGEASQIRLTADKTTLSSSMPDVTFVEVELLDAQGRPVPDAENLLTFKLSGPGTLLAAGNANLTDTTSYANHLSQACKQGDKKTNSTTHAAWKGRAICAIRSGRQPATLKLQVSGQGLKTQTLTLRVQR